MAPYNGGESWLAPEPFLSLPKFVAAWARRNGCAPDPVESRPAADVTRREYVRCTGDAAVVFYTLHGGGHVWPGGEPLPVWFVGPDSRTVDATREMWAFFRAHPRTSLAQVTAQQGDELLRDHPARQILGTLHGGAMQDGAGSRRDHP